MDGNSRRDASLERRSMSISPPHRKLSPDYRDRSFSPVYRRHNGTNKKSPTYQHSAHKSHRHNSDYSDGRSSRCSGYDSDKEYHTRRDHDRSPRWERQSSRERSRSRERRDKDRERHTPREREYEFDGHRERFHRRDRDRRRNSWDRKSDENHRSRDRSDRSHRDDDRESIDSERSQNNTVIGASGSEIIGYKSQPPNNTIMIRGLAQHITENDVRQDIIQCGLMPKDIRLIRKKDTGASRGFAFVEFTTLQEATRWMEMKQGILMLQDQYRAIMQYSIPKELCQQSEKPPSNKATADWFCIKCGAQNFKRRDNCFKCHASRMESEEGGSGSDEICTYATKTIMLRNLDALTTEDSVMSVLSTTSGVKDLIKTVIGVCIGRDPLTSTSRGICYLGLDSTVDALALYGALTGLATPLSIDGKTVIISYCKYHMGDVKKAFTQAGIPNANQPSVYSMSDLNTIADYSASRYAKNTTEYEQYFQYYKAYFAQQITAGQSITLSNENQMDAANAAAAVAHSAIQQLNANKTFYDSTHMHIPNGTDGKRYPIPDTSKYQFDKNSGYQYDPSTGLYYDPNSQYYYNSVIQKYLYWDPEKLTYVLAPGGDDHRMAMVSTAATVSVAPTVALPADTQAGAEPKKAKSEKQDKVKVGRKIVKDMERWAKTLNQKKENTLSRSTADNSMNFSNMMASADIGFAVLEKKNGSAMMPLAKCDQPIASSLIGQQPAQAQQQQETGPGAPPLVAAYGESDDSGEDDVMDDSDFLDFAKLICNLCKRQLGSKDALAKHAKLSTLHKQNMELRKAQRLSEGKIKYRDRAKERRLKYGESDDPAPSKLKEKYLKSREIPESTSSQSTNIASEPIGSENVGNRLLQKMGWTEGQGLGKSNQGRTSIIQAEQRNSTVGLGNKMATYTAMPGETYKDCVKKMMYARYQELSERN